MALVYGYGRNQFFSFIKFVCDDLPVITDITELFCILCWSMGTVGISFCSLTFVCGDLPVITDITEKKEEEKKLVCGYSGNKFLFIKFVCGDLPVITEKK